MIGAMLAHYEILDEIGAGGMGTVYRARDTKLGREVAIKVLPREMAADEERLKRFQREARTVAALNHPNIVTIYSVEEVSGPDPVHFLTMELIRGETLADSIPEQGLTLDALLDVAVPLADAMTLAHEEGVVHRDLKPTNVMRDSSGRVRVLDFGLATLLSPKEPEDTAATLEALTAAGQIMGTVAYMAPEQLDGRRVDHRADVFALGVILYEMAAGSPPFRGESVASIASSVLRDEPAPLSDVRPDLPGGLFRIIRRCLHKDAGRRIQTARDVRNELEELRRTPTTMEEKALETSSPGLSRRRFVLTVDHVRELSERLPRMVGDSMTYLDNEADSDVLVLCLHGFGADERAFRLVLESIPYRAISLSLYGFGPDAPIRPSLALDDHMVLLDRLVEDLDRQIRPRIRILVGFSSGGDLAVRWIASRRDPRFDGLVVLGLNLSLEMAYATRRFARLSGDPGELLGMLKGFSESARTLDFWLIIHAYMVQMIEKFGTDIDPLRRHGRDIAGPFEKDDRIMYSWLQEAMDRVPHIRCVFAEEEAPFAETLLSHQLEEDVLGDRFREDMVAIAPVQHLKLTHPDTVLPHVEDVLNRVRVAREKSASRPPSTSSRVKALDIQSLAVMPLDNHSGDPAQDYFADGMTEAITAQVAKLGRLRVISRTSVMQYKGSKKPLPQIAEELGVDAVVEGSVLRSGDRVRITAQLIHAATDQHLWAETYDRDVRDVLELQSEVSRAIVEKIQVALDPGEESRPAARRMDPEVYESYLRGRFCWNQRDNQSLRQGIVHFREVIAKDPAYAPAYVGIAECYNVLGFQGATPARESFAPAIAAARQALDIDPSIAEAHISLGYASIHYDFNWKEAEASFLRGIELNPNYPTGHHWYALYLANLGRRGEALAEMEKAWELDPLAPIMRTAVGWIHYMFGDAEAAIEHYGKVKELNPDFWSAHLMAGAALTHLGRYDEAVAEVEEVLGPLRNSGLLLGIMGRAQALAGRSQEARECLDRLDTLAGTQYIRPYDRALVHIGLGETEAALKNLEAAYEERGNWLNYMRLDPALEALRTEPRFQSLLTKVFPEA